MADPPLPAPEGTMIRAASLYVAMIGQVLICRRCGAQATVAPPFELQVEHEDDCPFIVAVEAGAETLLDYLQTHGDPMYLT